MRAEALDAQEDMDNNGVTHSLLSPGVHTAMKTTWHMIRYPFE